MVVASAEETPLVVIGNEAPRAIWPRWCASAILILIGFSYGSMDVTFRLLFTLPTPPTAASACLIKTFLGTLVLLPAMMRASRDEKCGSRHDEAKQGFQLAIWNVTSGGAIYAGLARTDAARAAFLMQLSVVATPVLERLVLRRQQPAVIWIGAASALCGVALLSSPDEVQRYSAISASSLFGDGLVILGAVLWGYYLVRTAALPPDASAGKLQAWKYLFSLVFYAGWALLPPLVAPGEASPVFAGWADPTAWLLILYGAWLPGAAADVLQQKAQTCVRASEASLLLASEPIWALLLAVPILGERFGACEIAGGMMIFLAVALASGVCGSSDDLPTTLREVVSFAPSDKEEPVLVASTVQPGAQRL